MNASPLQALLSRRVCTCNPTIITQHLKPVARRLTDKRPTSRHASTYASHSPTFGSSEALKRRYQPTPESVKQSRAERERVLQRMKWSAVGILLCAAGMLSTVYYFGPLPDSKEGGQEHHPRKPSSTTSFDAPPSIPGVSPDASSGEEAVEQVPTGTSTIPTFPKTIHLSSLEPPSQAAAVDTGEQEYQLVGLGIRTVSFLGIQVYVVGLYIAVADIATLQERLVRTVDPVATTLVTGEKDKLRQLLLDPERGEEVWNSILKDGGIRTAIRIVPTRNTDYMHLRDGWVRGITARTQHFALNKGDASFTDDSFGRSVNDFKAMWGGGARKSVPKGEVLLMTRDAAGKLAAWHEDKKGNSLRLGGVDDERVSRLIWLGYLGGKSVSSEGARHNVVEGVMEYVERPVGTVATQVV